MPRVIKKNNNIKSKEKEVPKDDLLEFEEFIAKKKGLRQSRPKGLVVFTLILLSIALSIMLFTDTKKQSTQKPLVYKTIYLESGQQLYGKVVKEDALYLYVDDVFYTKMETVEVPAQEEGGEPQSVERARLVARGGELNAPVGPMQINRSKVFAIDEMGQDSEVLKLINQIKAGQ